MPASNRNQAIDFARKICADGRRDGTDLGRMAAALIDSENKRHVLGVALLNLVILKDGPRDSMYYAEKEAMWEAARTALRHDDRLPEEAPDVV